VGMVALAGRDGHATSSLLVIAASSCTGRCTT
jgi:hypothetical protein